jgi:SAM-dependent methyltransferase
MLPVLSGPGRTVPMPITTHLPRVVPAPPERPERPGRHAQQQRAHRLATRPGTWSAVEAADVVATYAALASIWDAERGGYRTVPLADALRRGGPFRPGRCLDTGSGTGLLLRQLQAVWTEVLALDLSPDMLARNPAARRVRGDAAHLPVRSGAVAAVVLGDAPLFAAEVCRVLTGDGCVLWCNALGDAAPAHVPTEVVCAALGEADGGDWAAVHSEAGWGSWAVLRRA